MFASTHVRFNGHRKCFKVNDLEAIGISALSQHCFDKHAHCSTFYLSDFRVGVVKVCKAMYLDREEKRFVTKFRTDIIGVKTELKLLNNFIFNLYSIFFKDQYTTL